MFSAESVVLRKYRIGEIHKGLVLLTESHGMIHAIAHGACKNTSRLAGSTEPITLGRVFYYHNPVKDSYKVTDVAVLEVFEGIKGDLNKYFTASLWAETVLKSLGGGLTDASLFSLLATCLRTLEHARGEETTHVHLQFVWRFLGLAGFRPSGDVCSSCGASVPAGESLYHAAHARSFVCSACSVRLSGARSEVGPGVRAYLSRTLSLSPEQARVVRLSFAAATALKRISGELLESVLEAPLLTVRAGVGIL